VRAEPGTTVGAGLPRPLEAIMKHDQGSRRHGVLIARIAFACGAILLIPGAGTAPQVESDELPEVFPAEAKADSKAALELKKAEDELKRAEEMYDKKSIKKARLEEVRRKLLELKVSALEEEVLRGEIGLAKSYLAGAEERADSASQVEENGVLARQMELKGVNIRNWKISEGLTLQQATFGLERADSRLKVYLKYTKPKRERDEQDLKQALDEGEAAQRLALAASPDEDGAKALPTQAVQQMSSPREAKSEWRKLAERRLKQRITAIRNELSPARLKIKSHEDHLNLTGKLHEKGLITESQFNKEKLALQNVKDFLKEMQCKLEELRQSPLNATAVKAAKNPVTIVDAPQEAGALITLKGIAREKGTGRPIEGAYISLGAAISIDGHEIAKSDKDGHYEFVDLPEAEEYSLVGNLYSNEPYFVTSARVKPVKKGEKTVNLDLDFVRGIPFRVRVLDKATGKRLLDHKTGKPVNGGIYYFPVIPNNPYKREVWGDSMAQETGAIVDAFHESYDFDDDGEYRGPVLPGPGVLCLTIGARPINLKSIDRKPVFFFPDGKDAVRILSQEKPPISAVMVPIQGASKSLAISLNRYTAVIAINPKEDAKEVSYEIKLDQAEALK
jgi:hypothetical protein